MADIDEEVRRAERMALAVAAKPNMKASKANRAKERLSGSGLDFDPKKKGNRRSRLSVDISPPPPMRERLDSADEEVRRAREMALAVAALGTEKGAMKAEDIRMAIADVITDTTTTSTKKMSPKRKPRQQSLQVAKSSPNKQPQQQFQSDQRTDSSIQTIMEELTRPPWILRNQNLFATIGIANILIIYVALSSEPCFKKVSNAVFIFNSAVSFFTVMGKRDPQNITLESQMNNADTAVCDDEESTKKQEALVDEMEKRIRPEKSITLEWLPDVQYSEVDLQALLDLQPESTLAERRRFLKARKGVIKAASAQLGSYIEWRSKNKIDEFFPSTFTTDEEDWQLAARGALEIANTSRESPARGMILPRIVSVYGGNDGLVLCRNGARIVHVLPSQLDTTIAPATTYALALAMYLDRKLDRKHTEKVTVVIDIRSGKGWPNPSSVSLVPFIKLVVGSLNSYFPERLSRCILFPLPMTATVIFNKAKGTKIRFWFRFQQKYAFVFSNFAQIVLHLSTISTIAYLDPDTATKIQVCSGAGSVSAAVPSKVKKFIDDKAIDIMERRRIAFFDPPEGIDDSFEGSPTTNKRIPWSTMPS